MDHLLRHLDLRLFNYETDIQSIVDMSRAREVLEGGWLDDEGTTRLHTKVVMRAQGQSIVAAVSGTILAYADLFTGADGNEGHVSMLRLHPDFHLPQYLARVIEHILDLGRKRGMSGWVLHVDQAELRELLPTIGRQIDRDYYRVSLAHGLPEQPHGAPVPKVDEASRELDTIVGEGWQWFLGRPVPPQFTFTRAFTAHGHAVRGYRPPAARRIAFADGPTYLGFFDGREWHLFRRGRHDRDAELSLPALAALANEDVGPGPLCASTKVIETLQLESTEEATTWDVFLRCN